MLDSTTPFIVKICGITREEDAESATNAGANALGFNFYPKSPRYLTPARAQRIVRSIPGPYLRVGVFVDPTEDQLLEAAALVPLDILQLHGRQPLHIASSFRIWQATQPNAKLQINRGVEAYLLDSPAPGDGGSGQTFDWSLAAGFPHRAIVAGGLDASNVAEAIRIAHPWGVDSCSRLEARLGKKDPARVEAFVQAALSAFKVPQETAP